MKKALHEPKRVDVGVRELRAHLSRWLEAVREGREVVVTDRGKPVARLTPFPEEDDWLDRMVVAGLATKGTRPRTPVEPDDLIPAEGSITELLIAQRRSRPH